jgi:hypothetical protein
MKFSTVASLKSAAELSAVFGFVRELRSNARPKLLGKGGMLMT